MEVEDEIFLLLLFDFKEKLHFRIWIWMITFLSLLQYQINPMIVVCSSISARLWGQLY